MLQVQIKNLAQIKAAFAQAPVLTIRHVNDAIRRSIFLIEGESKVRTPVRTGFLRASHQTAFSMLKGEVGPTASYAIFVHEGTRRMRARPFLFNAVKTAEERVQEFFTKAVQNVLDDIGRMT